MYLSKKFKKAACLCLCAISAAGIASAQDKIYTTDGNVLDAKVKEVNQRSIVYRRWDNQDGADYVLTRREVERIVYENGTEENFEQRTGARGPMQARPMRPSRSRGRDRDETSTQTMSTAYGRNILAVAPIQMTNESVAGVGIHYERILDKAGVISFYLPVAFGFYRDQASSYSNGNPSAFYEANRVHTNIYPGIKFYPGGSGRRVSYSVGPSFGFGFGTIYKEREYFDQSQQNYIRTVREESAFRAGFMINNGINIQPTPHLYIGTELGLGITYIDNSKENFAIGNGGLIQFSFKMGYRF